MELSKRSLLDGFSSNQISALLDMIVNEYTPKLKAEIYADLAYSHPVQQPEQYKSPTIAFTKRLDTILQSDFTPPEPPHSKAKRILAAFGQEFEQVDSSVAQIFKDLYSQL